MNIGSAIIFLGYALEQPSIPTIKGIENTTVKEVKLWVIKYRP